MRRDVFLAQRVPFVPSIAGFWFDFSGALLVGTCRRADTLFLIDGMRPDILMLRVLARALVVLDDTQPTSEWLSAQVPVVLREVHDRLHDRAVREHNVVAALSTLESPTKATMHLQTQVGIVFVCAAGRGVLCERSTLTCCYQRRGVSVSLQDRFAEADLLVDMQSIKEAHSMCVAGACLAMALAFAGTADPSARSALLSKLMYFRSLRATFADDTKDAAGVCLHLCVRTRHCGHQRMSLLCVPLTVSLFSC
jgi:hypothetical protein